MLAVIKLSGSQHVVKQGDILKVNKLNQEIGSEIVISEVLSIIQEGNVIIGAPLVANSFVKLTVLDHGKDKKVIVFKKRRRQGYKRKNGHRQHITTVQVKEIS
jgi:large subunit ribosomal protein L21